MTGAPPQGLLTAPFLDNAPIGLGEVVDAVDLQTRFDTKYVMPTGKLARMAAALAGMRVLEVDGRRVSRYTTVYYDTPDLLTYRWHAQGRRRRYKVRTRTYGDSGTVMLEVKVKDRAGRTVKHRIPHPAPHPEVLGDAGRAYVAGVLADVYGFTLPPLEVSATTRFWRVTLVDLDNEERLTLDHDLSVRVGDVERALGSRHVLLESKSPRRRGQTERTLRSLGVRPARVSKYCMGVAALRPDRTGNRWRPVLRTLAAGR